MSGSEQRWRDVDGYFAAELAVEDEVLARARAAGRAAGLPEHEVAPNQGRFLELVCLAVGARRVLEFGTLAGCSTIRFARAVGAGGSVVALEVDERCAEVARANFVAAGVADRVELLLGPAADSARGLVEAGVAPFDVVFIDADKPNNPVCLEAALRLPRSGTVIVVDNVVRDGAVVDAGSADPRVLGSRALVEALGRDERVAAVTALQTVGAKGWDGFALAVVE
ncbi:O-methyltransferase [Actinosynnema pretiosum]|uniref:O-methyltransferase n=1 Tax=Actinosynnema pretiosum TaxID=42197 RepID=UPI000AEB264F|nr:O-methyltransferase [Actinosynnema pretiosum]